MKHSVLKSGIVAGLIAGAAFMMLEMILVPLVMGGSPWGPPYLIAAIGMGKDILPPPPPSFDATILMVAMLIHFGFSMVFGVILAYIIKNMGMGAAIAVGVVYGLLLYFINFYGFTALFPWFAKARNGVTLFTHAMFGLIAAWLFKLFYQERTEWKAETT